MVRIVTAGPIAWAASIGLALIGGTGAARGEELKAGDPAPAFKLEGSDGKTYELKDFQGKSGVVLAWFPKAFTGG